MSCQINTDGVSLFKSGVKQLWPVFMCINEMSFKKRRKNTVLVALWFGAKPKFTTFLKPLIDQCNELQSKGLTWKHKSMFIHSLIRFPIFTADSMGRPLVQGFKQHNGYFGCPWCLAPGERDKVIINTTTNTKNITFTYNGPILSKVKENQALVPKKLPEPTKKNRCFCAGTSHFVA